VYDEFGRERLIDRKAWHDQVLPQAVRNNWHNADGLYSLLAEALGDGYEAAIVKAAEHLHKLDKRSARSTCLYGIVLMRIGKIGDAARVMRAYLATCGEDGYVLLNLAKVYSAGNDKAKARETLWRAIEANPNVENALQWYGAIERDERGPSAQVQAWRQIAGLPNSWRARLFLARDALEAGNPQDALALYEEALKMVGDPPPADVLMMITGDLGTHGKIQEALTIGAAHFSAEHHGLTVGNNLIKAHFELNQFDAAQNILETLYAQGRPDYKHTLDYWAAEISKARIAKKNERLGLVEPIPVSMVSVSRPLWLPDTLPVNRLFGTLPRTGRVIAILGSTASFQGESPTIVLTAATVPGIVSRALPLFLCQELFFRSSLPAKALVPWVTGKSQGHMLGQKPWTNEYAAEVAARADVDADWILIVHLNAKNDPWIADFRLVRSRDAVCACEGSAALRKDDPAVRSEELTSEMRSAILTATGAQAASAPSLYDVPKGKALFPYLMSLEGLITLQLARKFGARESLNSPRDIVDRVLTGAVDCPSNVAIRMLLVQTVIAMKNIEPSIASEYQQRLERISTEFPLQPPVNRILAGMMAELTSGQRG
jgi:tetratricopeptide (TPR) repeat protein